MKTKSFLLLTLVVFAVFSGSVVLVGCKTGNLSPSEEKVRSLQLGMTEQQVIKILGAPKNRVAMDDPVSAQMNLILVALKYGERTTVLIQNNQVVAVTYKGTQILSDANSQ